MIPRIAIATCSEVPDLDADAGLLAAALARRGVDARPVVWDDDPDGFATEQADAVVLRSTWDYPAKAERFLAWTASVRGRLFNDAATVAWNLDKRYLRDLAQAGIPTAPTTFLEPGDPLPELPAGRFVVKPAVSAGSKDTALYDGDRAAVARAHVARLQEDGRAVLVQPYLEQVEKEGETALVYVDGVVRHAMRKEPLLALDQPFEEGLFRQEEMSRREPDPGVVALGDRVVGWVAARFGTPLYARVDTLPGDDGRPVVLEVELIEPSLFLDFCPDTAEVLADALLARSGP
jgi:hypothetical protein